jgi:opacity protein-like surface antigen
MKKYCSAALLAAIWISPFGGYRFNGSLNLDDPNFRKIELKDNPVYGLAVGGDVMEGVVEVMWTHHDSHASAIPMAGGPPAEGFDLNVDQFHLNGLYIPQGFEKVEPYALAGLGVTHYAPVGAADSMNRFSWALGGGTLMHLNSRLALRLEGKWNPALMSSSSSAFCNTSTGRCYVAASGDLINQFDFTAGLTLRI